MVEVKLINYVINYDRTRYTWQKNVRNASGEGGICVGIVIYESL